MWGAATRTQHVAWSGATHLLDQASRRGAPAHRHERLLELPAVGVALELHRRQLGAQPPLELPARVHLRRLPGVAAVLDLGERLFCGG